ncbi:hypothetical protein [Phosphitispora sp. TUW77]|uniref:hypothetical protein n=1 Tax=Phosphitispora sp. TUW77 TaxID=3152361 RepID=UPI003AB14B62
MIKTKVIQADGAVQGAIGNGNSAAVEAVVSCVDGVPSGYIDGSAEVFSGGPVNRKFKFYSNNALIVATLKDLQSLGAIFDNVSVQEDEFTPITGCRATIDATRLNSGQWVGSFNITCPDGLQLFFYGTFSGQIVVNREVFCQPLL